MNAHWRGMARWPLWMCGFRPFFLLAGMSACLLMLLWLALLYGVWSWQPPGGLVVWHGAELVFGFGMAAVAGFLLTAVAEFTAQPAPRGPQLAALAAVWLLARLAWLPAAWLPHPLAVVFLALPNLGFVAWLVALLLPMLWRDRHRAHLGFGWALLAMLGLEIGFFMAVYRDGDALAWLRVTTHLMMLLLVMAGSRISMNVVNRLIEAGKPGQEASAAVDYLARPPRRNLAILCMGLVAAVEFFRGSGAVTGWAALATAAAMLNLLNDWHRAHALRYRWALMLYACYWLLALGYAALGLSMLGAPWLPSAGRHLLLAGGMGLSIFVVMNIVSRIHSGHWLDRRPWLPLAAGLLLGGALLRALSGAFALAAAWSVCLQALAGLLWIAAFALYLGFNIAILTRARSDGQDGCAAPVRADGQDHHC